MANYVQTFAEPPFDWGDDNFSGLGSDLTKELVEDKFNATMATAEDMMVRLVGTDGDGGYLGALNAVITDYSAPDIPDFSVAIPSFSLTTGSRPIPDLTGLVTSFPSFDIASPAFTALPTIDLSSIDQPDLPAEVSAAISWLENAHNTELYSQLLTRILADLPAGSTGLDPVVEQEIFDRASARQDIIDDAAERDAVEFFASRGFDLPTGAMAGRLQEMSNERARNRTELNGKILIEQAELAQKNTQFIIQVAKDLESVLRDFTSRSNDRNLDYAKAVAANTIAIYAENVRAYIAAAEAAKMYVEVQVENLKAVIEANKGVVELYKSQAEAYSANIEGKAKQNEAITGVFSAEVQGYEAETRAISANQAAIVSQYELELKNADVRLRAAIAEVEASLGGFTAESGLREKVAEAMANIASQAVASAYGAVNASASLAHSTGRDQSESWSHGETRGMSYSHGQSLSEDHGYAHDPTT